MAIFSKRKAAQREAEARVRGENVDYLTREIPEAFRLKLWFAMADGFAVETNQYSADTTRDMAMEELHGRLLRDYGKARLSSQSHDALSDLEYWIRQLADADELMDIVERSVVIISGLQQQSYYPPHRAGYPPHRAGLDEQFTSTIREAVHEHKLAFDVIGSEVVERHSAELHQTVVVPALTLLHGRKQFAQAERQYQDALEELAHKKWADAITDANAAVEVTLRTIVGHIQGQLPSLLDEARRRKIFGEQEDKRLRKFVDGFTALSDMRNEEGDAHGNTSTRDAAWLAVHWAGALIVYIVERAEALGISRP